MGPQVGYYSPEVLMELDLHGGGIDARGATFPGISLYVVLGRGRDFAWSTTTAYSDNVDEFAEKLCEPAGGAPSRDSDHYLYRATSA
jgi:acyl-homoserine lactone acylase PvdQ